MPGGLEDIAGVLDADGVVGRGVQDQQRQLQVPDLVAQIGTADILDESPLEGQCLAADHPLPAALGEHLLQAGVVLMLDMGGVERRTDGHHRTHPRAVPGRRDGGGPTPGVAHQQVGGGAAVGHEPTGFHQIVHLDGERTVTPVAPRTAQPECIEPQHADAVGGQLFADPGRRR